jgi:two-component system sensor histidine kinase/response regulator
MPDADLNSGINEGKSVHQQLMQILSSAGISVMVAAGENGRIISVNRSACEAMGKKPEELIGTLAEELFKKRYECGLDVNRQFVEENGVVFQVFSFTDSASVVSSDVKEYRRIFNDMDALYFRTSIDGRIESVSPAVNKFAGYTQEELIGKYMVDYYADPSERGKLMEALQKEGRVLNYPLDLLKKTGEVIHTRGSIHLIHSDKDASVYLEGILSDISDWKKLEKENRKHSMFFREVLESVPDGVVTVDKEGKVTGWNREAVKLFGWTVEEALGKPLDDLVSTGSGKNEIACKNVIEGQVIRGLECTRRGRNQLEKKVFVSVAPITVEGVNEGAVGIYTDLSNRETILEKLRENEIRFRTITESAQDAVIIMDDDGRVSFFNTSAERMFGYHRSETVGQKLHELIAPDAYWEMFEMGFRDFRSAGRGIMVGRVVEMEGRRKNGSLFPVELSVSSFFMNDGWHATGILRDITERKKTELELIEAREGALNAARTKSEFLANMSHEIRTPLNAILGTTDLLLETEITPRQKNYLRVCRNAGDNLLALISDILDISKVEAGRIELEEIPFDLYENMERTCETLALRTHEKGLELNCRIYPSTPRWVTGDPSRLRQVLTNLIGNSIKFTEKGEVTVEVQSKGKDGLTFSIIDTGIGIPEGKVESIFMSFTQADSSHTRRYGGTGLGLTICRKLVELMGGEISVKSEVGKGSTFTFYCRMPEIEPPLTVMRDENKEIAGRRMLVVDDNENTRMILKDILTGWDAAVDTVSNGETAVEMAGKTQYDVILLDCTMPEIDGFETATFMRRNGLSTDSVILMLTSDDSGSRADACSKYQIDHFLVKPVRIDELRTATINAIRGYLPAVEINPLPAEKEIAIETMPLSILLAEDSPDNRFLLIKYTEKYPWKITIAVNGQEAIDHYMKSRFDLILMDMQMPVMDGYEATRFIRAHESNTAGLHTPVVALTAHAMQEEVQKCLDAGCDIHISKPVRKNDLIERLDNLLNVVTSKEGSPELSQEKDEVLVALVPSDLKALIPGYLANRRTDVLKITDLISTGVFEDAGRLAHSMKGSGGGYGFDGISRIGAEMEKAAKAGNASGVLAGVNELKIYLDKVQIEYVDEE